MLDTHAIRADWTPEYEWEMVNESRTILELCDEVERLRDALRAGVYADLTPELLGITRTSASEDEYRRVRGIMYATQSLIRTIQHNALFGGDTL